MNATESKVEILASREWPEDFGSGIARVAQYGDKAYLVVSEWTGRGSMHGEANRPCLYLIPASMVRECVDAIERWDDERPDNMTMSNGQWLRDVAPLSMEAVGQVIGKNNLLEQILAA